jgi:Toprim domain/Winged helix-turn-helix DNA-binding
MTNIYDNPKRFNAATLKVIEFLDGDVRTGKCFCPCHDDGQKPSLQVSNGDKVQTVVHCWGRGCKEHDDEIIAHLRANGVWPTTNGRARERSSEQPRSPEDRRRYALELWEGLSESGRSFAPVLNGYLNARGIKEVPTTARVTLPPDYLTSPEDDERVLASHDPGLVLPVVNKEGELQGIHVTWLNADMTAKRDAEPQRQSYGSIKGNFVQLTEISWDNPPDTLLVGEGAETTLAAMQVTELPGIASAGAGMMEHLDPPRCRRYIILADNGDAGQHAASALAGRLLTKFPECAVHIAKPVKPQGGKTGYDWNDALVDAGTDKTKLDGLRRAILEALPFEPTATEGELIDALVKNVDDPIAFERGCKAAAKKLDVTPATVKKAVTKRRSEFAKAAATARVTPDMGKLRASAQKIIECEDVLALFANEIGRLVVGEEKNAKTLYLAGTSRLFDKTMHMAIKGPSSGGKSEIRKRVLDFFPTEHVFAFTSLSDKALLYMRGDFAHKILSMGEAINGKEIDFQDYLLRELMSEGKLLYPVVQKIHGELVTTVIEKNGPVVFMVTTTRNKLNPENETRMLSLEVNDSEEQTKAVLGKVAEVVGLNRESVAPDFRPWHDYQRWLAAGECKVSVPFAGTLSRLIKATRSVRLRRDFTQLLVAIRAHALLHRTHRERGGGSIIATIEDDYAAVRELMADLLATASELKVRQAVAETVRAVEMAAKRADQDDEGAKVREIADELGLDRTVAHRRLKAAEEAGFIVNLNPVKGPGHAARYRGTGEQPISDGDLLPTAALLRQEYEAERLEEAGAPSAPVHPGKRAQRCDGKAKSLKTL